MKFVYQIAFVFLFFILLYRSLAVYRHYKGLSPQQKAYFSPALFYLEAAVYLFGIISCYFGGFDN